jgi:Protein of unknown function (DUF3515)
VTAVLVPLVVLAVVLVRVLGGGDDAGRDPVAEVEGSPTPARADTAPLPVQVPPVTPEADASCPALMGNLPLTLAQEQSRPVDSASPYAYAWGDPAVVLVCGVDRPAGFVATAGLIQIDGVQWYVDDSDPDTVVWTTVDRPVYVQVAIPSSVDSGPVAALSPVIGATLPYRDPQPGP